MATVWGGEVSTKTRQWLNLVAAIMLISLAIKSDKIDGPWFLNMILGIGNAYLSKLP